MATAPTKKRATTAKTTKPAVRNPAAAKAAPKLVVLAAEMADDNVATPSAVKPIKAVSELKLKDLIERVVEATGSKRNDVREIVDTALTLMGDALQKGETLNLPAFGKVRVARQAGGAGSGAMTLKLRRGAGEGAKNKAAKEPLAEADEQS